MRCGEPCARGEADVHHLMPRALGGSDDPSNLVTLCDGCHAAHHPTLQASLARRMLERWGARLARWLEREGALPADLDRVGVALRLLGKSGFREGQLAAVLAALRSRSVLMVSPTGSGKSLCFQLPALLRRELSLVLSPLKALMSDQVAGLTLQKIPVTFLNSSLSVAEKRLRLELVEAGAIKLLYCAPERFDATLADPATVERMKRLRPAFLVVDEAHCVDRWGIAFRPNYGRIADIRRSLGNPPVLAFTATAGLDTQRRILKSLGAEDAEVIVSDVDRPNIALLRVPGRTMAEKASTTASLLDIPHGGRTMIFVPTVRLGGQLQAALAERGHEVPFFHGRLDKLTQEFLLGRFSGRLEPELRAIICTNAFGMGLDVPDVRLVVHLQTPASIEDYVQEFGRAGRDGRQSVAVIFGNRADAGLHRFMLEKVIDAASKNPDPAISNAKRLATLRATRHRQIDDVTALSVETTRCFRRGLHDYFQASDVLRGKPLYLRLLAWIFGERRRKVSRGGCCDFCDRVGVGGSVDYCHALLTARRRHRQRRRAIV